MTTLWCAQNGSRILLAVCFALVGGIAATGCGDDPVRADNFPPTLTSIGPIDRAGDQVTVDFSLRDAEGDDVTVRARVCESTDQGEAGETCFRPAEGTASDGISLLPTTPKDTDVPHRFAWAVGCGLGNGGCESPSLGTEYVVRLITDDGNEQITSAVFTLGDIGFEAIPSCDAADDRTMNRPSACQ